MSTIEVFILILRRLFIDRKAIEINTQVFSWENVVGPPQTPWLWTEKKRNALAIFSVGTAAKCYNKRCVDQVRSTEHNKDDSTKANFVT